MGMSTDEWRLLVSTRATGRGDRTTGRDDNSCGALIDGRGERHTAFIDHMPEHPSDEYRQLHEWADGYGWMLTPDADRLADRIIDGMDPHPAPAVAAALAACYPDRLIMADTRAVRRPAERWFHEAGPLRLDRYMRGGMGDVARMIVHDRLHPDMPVLAGRRLDELIDTHAYDALIATGMGDMLTVAQWTSIARHGDPAACRILDGMRRGMDDALACGRLRGMCTPA